MCIACREKGNDDLILISSLLLADSLWDRPEKYDRDVQIIAHTPIAEYSPAYSNSISCDVNYSDADLNYFKDLLQAEIARYPRVTGSRHEREKSYPVEISRSME